MKIVITNFGGEVPRLGPRLLPPFAARIAQNVKLFSRELRSWRAKDFVFRSVRSGTMKSMYRMYSGSTDAWCTWADAVNAVKGPIAGDTTFKLYYTGDLSDVAGGGNGWPKKTNYTLATGAGDYPNDYLEMGVPAPTNAPSVAVVGGTAPTVTRTYVYTFVTSWGEEGPPSAWITFTGNLNGTWNITMDTTKPTGWTKADITHKRLYRAYTSGGVTDYYFVAQYALAATNPQADGVSDATLVTQGTIPSLEYGISGSEWSPPPTNLRGLISGANGQLAGYSGNKLCISHPYQPHAWPTRYQYAVPWDIQWIGAFGNSYFIATKGRPFIASGSHPASMNIEQVERSDMAAVSSRSGAVAPFGAAFATNNGLAVLGSGGARHITEPFMTRDEWQDLCFPSTLIGAAWGDRYVGFFTNSAGGTTGFIFDPTMDQAPLSFLTDAADGAYTDPETGKLYILQSNVIYEFDADEDNSSLYVWQSKQFVLPRPLNLGCYKIDADFDVLGGAFAEEASAIAADNALNQTIKTILGTETYPGPALQLDALGTQVLGGTAPETQGRSATAGGPIPSPWAGGPYLSGSVYVGTVYSTYANRSLNFKFYSQDYEDSNIELKLSEDVTDNKPHRLPKGFTSEAVACEVAGNIPVRAIYLASTVKELEEV